VVNGVNDTADHWWAGSITTPLNIETALTKGTLYMSDAAVSLPWNINLKKPLCNLFTDLIQV
jgi:hypothetical protein